MSEIPPLPITDRLRAIPPGGYLIVEDHPRETVQRTLTRIKKLNGAIYVTRSDGPKRVEVWRIKEEQHDQQHG